MRKVVADVDTGIDDALALVYLAHLHAQGEIDLVITTSAGNCTSSQAARNSQAILQLCGVEVPVQAGAAQPMVVELTTTPETHGPQGLGYANLPKLTTSVESFEPNVEQAVQAWQGATDILIAGPATNLVHAQQHSPQVLEHARICCMTGSFNHPGNTTETAEWNAWVDPDALAYMCEHRADMVLCGLNVTEQVILTPERLAQWQQRFNKLGKADLGQALADALRFYFEFHQEVGVGYCAQIHDLAAAMVLLGRIEVATQHTAVQVATDDTLRGTTTVAAVGPRQQVVRAFDPAAVFAEFETVVFGCTNNQN